LYTPDLNKLSTDIKNLSDSGPDQNKKPMQETGDITTGYERFEISIDFVV